MEHGKLVAFSYYEKGSYKKLAGQASQTRKRKLDSSDLQVMAGPHVTGREQEGRLEFLEVPLKPDEGDFACVTCWH